MFKNYLKMTWAVMKRRKFYTFISLFGISLTLTILIVLSAFFDSLFAPTYPERNRERTLYIQNIKEIDQKNQGSWISPLSLFLIKNYVAKLETPEKVAMISAPMQLNTYLNNQRGKLYIRYTDANFWQVNSFDFIEGRGFTEETLRQNDNAVIITEDIRDTYFGKGVSVEGQILDLAGTKYRIMGVTRGGTQLIQLYSAAEIYLPYTANKSPQREEYNGDYFAMILAKNEADLPKIQTEFAEMIRRLPLKNHGDFVPDTIVCHVLTYMRSFTSVINGNSDPSSGYSTFFMVIGIFAFLFMLLPALNLVNINVSRIMERASEIGIRKAFGASAGTLTIQFIIENVILTVIGGGVALVLSSLAIAYLNRTGVGPIPSLNLTINWTVLGIALGLSLFFGLMSGVLPAFRMAKLPVAEALKG